MRQKASPEVLILTTATPVVTAMDGGWVMIQNKGPNAITLTNEDGVVNGPDLAAGSTTVVDKVRGTIYAKCTVAQVALAGTRVYGDIY